MFDWTGFGWPLLLGADRYFRELLQTLENERYFRVGRYFRELLERSES